MLTKHWYAKRKSCVLYMLLPFSWLFYAVVMLRRFLYRAGLKRVTHFSVPVIVVGNITVGGTGKTPCVIWLARCLMQHGYKVGIVSRGYGGKKHRQPHHVTSEDTAWTVGDEPYMIARHVECPVVVHAKRVRAVQYVLQHFQCDVVLSDDGLQHYAMGRDIEIALIDGMYGFGNRCLLPAGPLREPVGRLKTVTFTINNMRLVPHNLHHVCDLTRQTDFATFIDCTIHAMAGIGNPNRFFRTLRECGYKKIVQHVFPDHHVYTEKDFQCFSSRDVIIMTEKDAVKCQSLATENSWFLPVVAEVDAHLEASILEKVSLCKNK